VRNNDTKVAKGELVFTSFLLVLSLVVLWDSFNLVEVGINAIVGPKAFAIGVGFTLLILTSLQIIAVLRGDRGKAEGIEGGSLASKSNWRSLLIIIGAVVFHIFALELIGFILATIPLFVAVAYALGETKWVRSLIVATVIAVGTFFGFTEGLKLDLPVGFEFLTEPTVIIDDDGEIVEEEGEETW
jgi:putative tricarboxylic transport membrane protein